MTVELAQKLKDAGLSQHESSSPYIPTLSELVAACDKSFWSLRRTPEAKWIATGRLPAKEGQIPYYESVGYDEPDVAVAELFLAARINAQQQ